MPDDYPVELLLTGDAQAGTAWFNGAGRCSTCHSPTGDLAGIAGKYRPVELQARFMMPRATKPRMAMVTLSSGERVTGESCSNTYEVSVRTSDGKTQTWPADSVRVDVTDPLQAHRDLLPKYTDAAMHNMFVYLWNSNEARHEERPDADAVSVGRPRGQRGKGPGSRSGHHLEPRRDMADAAGRLHVPPNSPLMQINQTNVSRLTQAWTSPPAWQ